MFDASKQTKRISANVAGLGPTIRISLNDNLLNRNIAGIKAVMGHEMGHYVLYHIQKLILYLSLMALAGFLRSFAGRRRGSWRATASAGACAMSPTRRRRRSSGRCWRCSAFATASCSTPSSAYHESEADAFGLDAAREPDGFAMTAMKLSEYRKIEPSALEERSSTTIRPGRTRVHMAMEWKARHLAELPPEQRGSIVMTPDKKAD